VKSDARGVKAPKAGSSALRGRDRDLVIAAALRAALEQKRDDIVGKWLVQTVEDYPDLTSRFFLQEDDRFRNPIGHALKEGIPLLVDQMIGDMDESKLVPALDSIVRIRAVQDCTVIQAVAFVFHLRKILRDVIPGEVQKNSGGLVPIESRIDRIALLAFDIFVQCREKMQQLKVNEMRRRMYLMERMHTGTVRMDSEADPENRVP